MDIELASAMLIVGSLKGELLSQVANDELASGKYSDSLAELANKGSTTLRDHQQLFERCLEDLGFVILDPHEAKMYIARYYSKSIVDGSLSPIDGVKTIVSNLVQHNSDELPPEIGELYSAEVEYTDFTAQVRLDYYGEEYCAKVRRDMEQKIVKLATKLIAHKNG